METSQLSPSRLLHSLFLVILFNIVAPVNALYFYMDTTHPKCFYEELPKDTLVVGQCALTCDFYDDSMGTTRSFHG